MYWFYLVWRFFQFVQSFDDTIWWSFLLAFLFWVNDWMRNFLIKIWLMQASTLINPSSPRQGFKQPILSFSFLFLQPSSTTSSSLNSILWLPFITTTYTAINSSTERTCNCLGLPTSIFFLFTRFLTFLIHLITQALTLNSLLHDEILFCTVGVMLSSTELVTCTESFVFTSRSFSSISGKSFFPWVVHFDSSSYENSGPFNWFDGDIPCDVSSVGL